MKHIITSILLLNCYALHAQTQLGSDIDGEAADDLSGMSVSMNSTGDRVAIGAFYNDNEYYCNIHGGVFLTDNNTNDMFCMGLSNENDQSNLRNSENPSINLSREYQFTSHIIDNSGIVEHSRSIKVADLDNDNDLDVVVAGKQGNYGVYWYENDGFQNYTSHLIGYQQNSPGYSFSIADIDSDGDIDIILPKWQGTEIEIYVNNGSGNFTTSYNIDAACSLTYSVSTGDLNGDGNLDMVESYDCIALQINDGNENFSYEILDTSSASMRFPQIADIDNDSDLDIITVQTDAIVIMYNVNGTFPEEDYDHIDTDATQRGVNVGDINNDGFMDIISSAANGVLFWHENDGSMDFVSHEIYNHPQGNGSDYIKIADMNGDTYLDIVTTYWSGDIFIHENNGLGIFSNNFVLNTGNGTAEPYCIDIDEDGDIDIVSTQANTDIIYWHENLSDNNVEYTYVPDDNFEQALIDLGYDDVLNDSVLTANISGVTTLNVNNDSISDLTGIEDFIALTELVCNNNQLDSLDVSNNTALTTLYCYYNSIDSLDVSNNTSLTSLWCQHNELTSLDVSNNTVLSNFHCDYNQLTSLDVSNNTSLNILDCKENSIDSLDVSNNTDLTTLHCNNNQLTSLDVSNNTSLTSLWCQHNGLTSLDVFNNTALTNLKCNNNQLDSLDVSANTSLTSLDCWSNQLTSLDVSTNTALTSLGCSGNDLTVLDVSTNTALTNLNCSGNELTALDMSNNTALLWLYCGWNGLTAVDMSNNTALRLLSFQSNDLTTLDVSSNTALTKLYCSGNVLSALDVSSNTALELLKCNDNQLTYLNMRNGVTDSLTTFNATGNSLTCIETLDPDYATANWTNANGNIDEGVTFAVDCTPDPPTLDPPTLVINEILAYNNTCCTDANGDYDSYLELYNYGDEEVDIGGMVITDDLNNYDHYYQIPTTQTVLANYPLATDVADQMGNFGDLTLYGNPTAPAVPSAGSPLYSNGIYAMDTLGQDISTPSITTLDNTNFQVDIEFNLASHGTGPSNPIIIGGGGYRWIGIINQSDGTVGVLYDNSNTVWSTTMLDTATWYSATLNYELGHVQLFIDGILAIDSTIASPLNHNYNNNFTTNNYSNGTALHGYMRNLRITNSTVANDSTIIQPGGFLLLWTDKESEQGILHLEIELLSRGGEVGLFMSDSTTVVDTLTFVAQSADTAYGRYPDNSATWQLMDPTPGSTNAGGLSLNDNIVIPSQYTLHQNFPNPFNPVTTLRYELPEQATVNITIYDMLGREVKTLINQTQDAGYKSLIWDATNDYGKPVSAGIYLYQIQAGEYMQTKKMVLLK